MIAATTNPNLPVMIDSDTQLNRLTIENKTLTFHYKLLRIASSDINPDPFQKMLTPGLLKSNCSNTAMTPILNMGASLAHIYWGKDNKEAAAIKMNASDCNEFALLSDQEKEGSSLESTLKFMSETLNKNLPMMVDVETQLLKTSAKGKSLYYHYEMINYSSDAIQQEEFIISVTPNIHQQLCTSSDFNDFASKGATFVYIYNGKDKKQIAELKIGEKECKQYASEK